jgi:hypothetical protein
MHDHQLSAVLELSVWEVHIGPSEFAGVGIVILDNL